MTFTSLLERRGQREKIRSEETELGVLDVVPYDRDHPAARELQVVPYEKQKQKQHAVSQTTSGQYDRSSQDDLLIAGDVERHSAQHDFGPHAFNRSSYSQVQLAAEGEMRRGAQVCQRLQGLSGTQHADN